MINRFIVLTALSLYVTGLNACGKKEKDKPAEDSTTETTSGSGGGGSTGSQSEDGGPEAGSGITFSNVTHTGFKVSWGDATDPNDKSFTYKVVYATSSDDIDTIDEADAITGSAVTDDLKSTVTSATITGLTLGTNYAVTVVVTNSDGKRAIYSPEEQTTLPMRIFITTTKMAPTFANAAAVDAYCTNDSAKPTDGSTYKAMIAGSNWRKACTSSNCTTGGASEHVAWVLAANTPYGRKDGTLIGTTNSYGLLPDPLLAAIDPAINYAAWGGFDSTWQSTGNNCVAWTNTSSGNHNDIIDPSPFYLDNSHWLAGGNSTCDNTNALICVEQ